MRIWALTMAALGQLWLVMLIAPSQAGILKLTPQNRVDLCGHSIGHSCTIEDRGDWARSDLRVL